jgi:IS30 family transposase
VIYDPSVELVRPARRRRRWLLGLQQQRSQPTAVRIIDERPIEAEDRLQVGYWERDLIIGYGAAHGAYLSRR